jgi:hypothetical protein
LSRISRSRGWFGALVLVCLLVGGGVATVLAQQQAQMAELFSSFMQKYSETPAFREKVLDVSRSVPKVGELLTPDMVRDLRALILGKHWNAQSQRCVDHACCRCGEQAADSGCAAGCRGLCPG